MPPARPAPQPDSEETARLPPFSGGVRPASLAALVVVVEEELLCLPDPANVAGELASAVILDAGTAREVTAGYARLVAPGSYLVVSCAAYDDDALAKRLAAEYTAGPFVNHTREDVASFFAGLDLAGPGVSEAHTWRPWQPEPVLRRRDGQVLAGVGRITAPDGQGASGRV